MGWLFQPDLSKPPNQHSAEEIAQAVKDRDVSFDPKHTPVIYREVDYAQGTSAPWYPKAEAPILAELVKEGKLPPVAERVPAEPVVMEGVEGIGKYGGTWLRVANAAPDVRIIGWRIAYPALVRWSPLGYPIVPHVAKSVVPSADRREWLITLRKGMKWSDGHPFTTDDIMYWWENDATDKTFGGVPPLWIKAAGKSPRFERLDEQRLKIVFEVPNGLFLETLAIRSFDMVNRPAHYLRQYHPKLGNQELIKQAQESYRMASPRALYDHMKDDFNPECPRLWPWVYRSYKSTPPQVFVRNPYYFAVDTAGNQLPYLDRLQFEVQDGKMLALSAANGLISMQARHIRYEDYTELMTRREEAGTRILHWYPGCRSVYAINPNLNRRMDPSKPDTKWKAQLLGDKRFRQALSLAINRHEIIKAEFNGQVEPSQVAPGPESPMRHDRVAQAFLEFDPARANALLDELGLTQRDYEGFRTFPDGTRMTFFFDFCNFTGIGPAQILVDDWGKVGVRIIPRERSRALFYTEKLGNDFDINVWTSESDYLPLQSPRYFVPVDGESFYAGGWGRWFQRGGFYGTPDAEKGNAVVPPKDHPIYRAMQVYDEALKAPTLDEQRRIFNEALDIAAENLWSIGISVSPPQLVVVKNEFRNVPRNAISGVIFLTPANAGIETYFFDKTNDSPGAAADAKLSIVQPTLRPGAVQKANANQQGGAATGSGKLAGALIKWLVIGICVLATLLVAFRHPYIGRRLLIMVPTMLVISVIVFSIIQLPPGDYLSTRIMQLQESGDDVDLQRVEELKNMFHFDEPRWKRYCRWMGLYWFASYDKKDLGLIQGNMGRSMETTDLVNDMIGDRILLTVLISLGTIIFTWATAIPIGIYSAVKQYSLSDYLLTFLGFIGMCVPAFLLALILMALSGVSGLFSARFAAQPEWDWPKVVDMLKHIWIPVVVLGVGGTAGMIRVMRANLLDELKKPYVVTARAKGVRPMKLLFKYPVRLALNPFISGIGGIFPALVSGNAIVSIVLSLPTVGPVMLSALFSQDMYLAASMLMVLSLLGVLGMLVSDLLLLWLDPRIRFKGGTR
jgi:ABC-type dipeptide/oligopeptide/nickel transport system permease component/ABC-type transport system substrate-binding protein